MKRAGRILKCIEAQNLSEVLVSSIHLSVLLNGVWEVDIVHFQCRQVFLWQNVIKAERRVTGFGPLVPCSTMLIELCASRAKNGIDLAVLSKPRVTKSMQIFGSIARKAGSGITVSSRSCSCSLLASPHRSSWKIFQPDQLLHQV